MTDRILSVAELNRQARRILEQNFPLLWVGGEISNLVVAASGHAYFSLKDSEAQVRCAMFRSRAQCLSWKVANGDRVEALARVGLYEARGEFQLTIENLRRAGIGHLYERFIRLRDQLIAEGLCTPERKRPLPRYPQRIGIVTSPQAAALRDVLAACERRAAHVELVIYPTLVQGTDAPAAIVAALEAARTHGACDVLLLVRGGGSLEDLWAFNDEAVARTLATLPMPTISGIGHETDTTIVDYITDQRAATPTAAAELATAGWFDAAAELDALATRLQQAQQRLIDTRTQTLDRLALRLIHPAQRLAASGQQVELLARRLRAALRERIAGENRPAQLGHRLQQAIATATTRQRARLAHCRGSLAALSPLATLERGYGIVRAPDGSIVRSATQLATGDLASLQFAQGEATARITHTRL